MAELSPSESTRFLEEGYAVLRGVFEPAELTALADHVAHLKAPPRSEHHLYMESFFAGFLENLSIAEYSEQQLRECERFMRLHHFDPETMRFLLEPRLFSILDSLGWEDALGIHSAFFPKPPGGKGIPLHADSPYFVSRESDVVGMVVAVDRADSENGAMIVYPRTHGIDYAMRETGDENADFPISAFQVPDGIGPVQLDLEPGDVALFHANILHVSPPNESKSRWRRAFIFHYVNGNVTGLSSDCKPAFNRGGVAKLVPPSVRRWDAA